MRENMLINSGARFIAGLFFILFISHCGLAVASSQQGKAVAVVYDDSTSMNNESDGTPRWVRANYAVKLLASTLHEKDALMIVRMSLADNKLPPIYRGEEDDINKVIFELEKKTSIGSTPYQAVKTAVEALRKRSEEEKWLVIFTDGAFTDGYDRQIVKESIQKSIDAKIKTVFVFIEFDQLNDKEKEEAEKYLNDWESYGATIKKTSSGKQIVESMEMVTSLLNGSSDNFPFVINGNEVLVSSEFPLRRLIMLRQDDVDAELNGVNLNRAGTPVSVAKTRTHQVTPIAAPPTLPKLARIYHLKHQDDSAISSGTNSIRLNFGANLEPAKALIKFLPVVAANLSMRLVDSEGKEMPRSKEGYYDICEATYRVAAILTDDDNKPLTAGRTDISKFIVKAVVSDGLKKGEPVELGFDAQKSIFFLDSQAGQAGTEVIINGSAEYSGYFHESSVPLRVRFGSSECRRVITLNVIKGINSGGVWQANIDKLEGADSVHLSATVKNWSGKSAPASAEDMETWRLDYGKQNSMFETNFANGEMLVRPRPFCCAWWWNEAGPGQYTMPVKLVTGRAYDTVNAPPDITFLISQPSTTWGKIRWYACPFALLAAVLGVLWYLLRLIRKSRFGPDARFEAEEETLSSGAIRPRTSVLREHSNAAKRWLWPSRGEVAELYGIRFHAFGEDVIADGRDLQKKHKIPGWVFDRSRLEASRKKDRQQENATLSDKMVMTIDEGDFLTRIRYRLQ